MGIGHGWISEKFGLPNHSKGVSSFSPVIRFPISLTLLLNPPLYHPTRSYFLSPILLLTSYPSALFVHVWLSQSFVFNFWRGFSTGLLLYRTASIILVSAFIRPQVQSRIGVGLSFSHILARLSSTFQQDRNNGICVSYDLRSRFISAANHLG
ncbi:hypothetical protein B0J18DRAFT_159220 [Chaetomium sp. MPI-SDFR-AT-0129]|nr:hypothetical protein B0J18DRAFT_159220 [Chaetomium sp. MPI-SDFR-AT-0129]